MMVIAVYLIIGSIKLQGIVVNIGSIGSSLSEGSIKNLQENVCEEIL